VCILWLPLATYCISEAGIHQVVSELGYPLMAVASRNPNPTKSTKNPVTSCLLALLPEQVAEQALREKAKLEAQSRLGQMLHEKRRNLRSCRTISKQVDSDNSVWEESNSLDDSSEDVCARRLRRHCRPHHWTYNDFKVDIPEFEGQLDSNLDWIGSKLLKESWVQRHPWREEGKTSCFET